MSFWDDYRRYVSTPKRPPPKDGIKLKRAGTTWWGQRWIEALERLSPRYSNRLARGKTYARAGRTHDLVVNPGRVTAKVTGSRPTPYAVTIELAQLSDAAWAAAIREMAQKAQFAAELLAGRMPEHVEEVFRAAKASLFPEREGDLQTWCSCPDSANPCKHVAATHYVLGEALDRDPFLLFELRGRTKEQVLDALRAARSAESDAAGSGPAEPGGDPEVPTVVLDALDPAAYERAPEPLPALDLSFDAPLVHGAVLRQLGTPSAWGGEASPADALGPLVRRAAERARAISLGEPEEPVEAEAAPTPSPAPKTKRARPSSPRRPKAAAKKRSRKRGSG